jgi:predicted phosphodiesterase
MRYAIVSDLHANIQAWDATLLDIRNIGVDSIICLGDIIGYGPNPAEVFASAYANINHFILGNHDAVVCGKMNADLFNDKARNLILWTHAQLGSNAIKFLKTLPLTLDGEIFRCSHGEFSNPAAYNYIIDPADAISSWNCTNNKLLFIGHSHVPGIFLLGHSGTPHLVPPQDFELEEGKRYLINVGSIGQPRDTDTRACYCIYDTDKNSVIWRRIPFDIDAYRNAMIKASLDPATTWFLQHDPRNKLPPLREILNFSPARTEADSVQGAIEVQDLSVLQHSRSRWRLLAILILMVTISLGIAGIILASRYNNRAKNIYGLLPASISTISAQPSQNLLKMPDNISPPDTSVDNWIIHLGNKRQQSTEVINTESGIAFLLKSQNIKDEMRLESPPINIKPEMRICIYGLFRKSKNFKGNIAISLSLTKQKDGETIFIKHFMLKEPTSHRKNNWLEARITEEMPAGSIEAQFKITGSFNGEVEIRDLKLERKK